MAFVLEFLNKNKPNLLTDFLYIFNSKPFMPIGIKEKGR